MLEARKLDMELFRKMGVYRKVHKSFAKGTPLISTRWVDTNKGTDLEPNYRSRLVAREIKNDARLDLFSATPPLEAKKMLFSMAVTEGIGWMGRKEKGMKIDGQGDQSL